MAVRGPVWFGSRGPLPAGKPKSASVGGGRGLSPGASPAGRGVGQDSVEYKNVVAPFSLRRDPSALE